MKRLLIGLFLSLCIQPAQADWHGFSRPDNITAQPIASRDLYNGQWLAGYSIDLLYWHPVFLSHIPLMERSMFYLALEHQYNASELTPLNKIQNAAGVFGTGLGISIGGLATTVSTLFHALTPVNTPTLNIPPWLFNDLDNWLTVEGNAGYRFFGHSEDVYPWAIGIGGKVAIKFDVTAHH